MFSNKGYIWWKKGFASGEILGGCVPSLNQLLGTEYWVDLKNKILFIYLPEGHNPGQCLSLSDMDAYFADLYNAGVFKIIKGLLIGRPYGYRNDKKKYEQLKGVIESYTSKTNYPILFNTDFGHTSPMVTIPMGAEVELDSGNNKFEIKGKFIN